jgi:putative cardiolipin synthase
MMPFKIRSIGLKAAALICLLLLSACASNPQKTGTFSTQSLSNELTVQNYEQRTWAAPDEIPFDSIEIGKALQAPIETAQAKPIGPIYQDSVQSLASKLWLIDNARYTLDLAYYIFKRDTVGYAVLGGLCNAVKRGVDIRLTIDSGGSLHPTHSELKALSTCADQAGYMLDAQGKPTDRKARIQIVIVNALSKVFVRMNRRSHDKLLIMDGHVPERAVVMTGGRNISVSYYGINEDGSEDPSAYQDMELIIKPDQDAIASGDTIGDVSTYYYSLLFLNAGNKYLKAPPSRKDAKPRYQEQREKALAALAFLKALPAVKSAYDATPVFIAEGFHQTKALLAHELANLTNQNVIDDAQGNLTKNANSIRRIYREGLLKSQPKRMRIVSPYFFFAEYKSNDGKTEYDGAASVLEILKKNPDSTFEMVTNSILTSDNFMAQSVIDMDTAPRMLLTPEMAKRWRASLKKGEIDTALVESPEWKAMVNNPRIRIYETGRLDAAETGGTRTYGKLHAKFMVFDNSGFVGTTNFDYRSRLFNNEFGFFFESPELAAALNGEFDLLVANSLLWGSPEWLELRKRMMAKEGINAWLMRHQRWLYKVSKSTGLIWLF